MKRIQALSILLAFLGLSGTFPTPSLASEPHDTSQAGANLLIDVSAAVVSAAVRREVDRLDPVREVIREHPVCGWSRTLGSVRAELIPDPYRAVVAVGLRGVVSSRTVATPPDVLIHTSTTTPLEARVQVVFDDTGVRVLPGAMHAESNTHLLGITDIFGCTGTPPTEVARAVFDMNREAAQAETAQKTAWRASSRLEENLSPGLLSASQSVSHSLKRLKRAGLSVDFLNFASTPTFLQARLRIGTPAGSQSGPCPGLPVKADLAWRLHQSVLNEAAEVVYGGRSVSLKDIIPLSNEITQGLVRDGRQASAQQDGLKALELLAALPGGPVTITLARKEPLTVTFTEQGFALGIQVASIRHGTTVMSGVWARAAYRLENTKDGVLAVRQGPVRFSPPERLSPAEQKLEPPSAAVLLLREIVFAELLKERLTLATRPELDSAARVRFSAPRASAGAGWLALAWNLEP